MLLVLFMDSLISGAEFIKLTMGKIVCIHAFRLKDHIKPKRKIPLALKCDGDRDFLTFRVQIGEGSNLSR